LIYNSVLNDFRPLAFRWAPFFRTQLHVALALQASNSWHLCYAVTLFSPAKLIQLPHVNIETKSIRAFRTAHSMDPQSAHKTLEATLADPTSFNCENWTASLKAGEHPGLEFDHERLYPARLPGPRRPPTLTITDPECPARAFPSIKELDQELLRHSTPYDGLSDLLLELGIPIPIGEIGKKPVSEIILLPPSEIFFSMSPPSSIIKNGKLSLVITAHPEIDKKKLRIGIKTFPADNSGIGRISFQGNDLVWDEEVAEFARGTHTIDVPNVPIALSILSYDEEYIGKWWINDPSLSFNGRLQLHRTVDTTNHFATTFFEDRNDFEDRIALLVTLIGLVPLKYGEIAHLKDAPDILALLDAGHLYVIDCTTGDINSKGKLHRLYERAKSISEILSRAARPPTAVLPVIATSLTRAETSTHWQTASNFRIAIIARENITNLLTQLDSPPTPENLYKSALSCIPEVTIASTTVQ
jgi:hypothetical protein